MNMLKEMMDRQMEVNINTMGEDWNQMGLDWRLAIVQESAELIDSFPWKWWKKGKSDFENARIEITDIWHFVMSMMHEEGIEPTDIMDEQLSIAANAEEASHDEVIKFTKELIRSTLNLNSSSSIAYTLMVISGKAGMDYETLTKMYFGKAVLNDFRQANGYKNGSYIKDWNGSEDNEVMTRLISSIEYSDEFYNKLYELLTEEYIVIA